MTLGQLQTKIEQKQAVIGVIGLGYVGLPVAAMFAQAGFAVIGVDIKAERVALINAGHSPIEGEEPGLAKLLADVVSDGRFQATTNYEELSQADVVLIDVETPVDENNEPRYEALRAVCRSLGPVLQDGALVVVESTIAPGTIDGVVRPLLEQSSGKQVNTGFFLGTCPERVMPGKLLRNLRTMSRVCGGSTPETAVTMTKLYRHIVEADLDTADPLTAELVKTTENAYRDVQIAFANEVALICEVVGADVWRVRELVNKSPYRQMHLPGAGVGGHCIPKDPWLLAYSARNAHGMVYLIPQARAINDYMPLHVAILVLEALSNHDVDQLAARVAILGYAYLENSDDTRNSPSEMLYIHLFRSNVEVVVHDPWVSDYQTDLMETVKGCDAAVLMVAHDAYRDLDLAALRSVLRTPILIDGRHFFDAAEVQKAGLYYRCVGQGEV
jgi:UDP-N-acetyl-D-mannosaminuronic acid dehydrogenase